MKGIAFPVEIFPKFVYPLPVRVAGGSSQPLSLYISARAQRGPTERGRQPVHTKLAISPIVPLEIDIDAFIVCRSFHPQTFACLIREDIMAFSCRHCVRSDDGPHRALPLLQTGKRLRKLDLMVFSCARAGCPSLQSGNWDHLPFMPLEHPE